MNPFKIVLPEQVGAGQVHIGDLDVSAHIYGVELATQVGQVTDLLLNMRPPAGTTVDGEARIRIDGTLAALLVSIGWTPPRDDTPRLVVAAPLPWPEKEES